MLHRHSALQAGALGPSPYESYGNQVSLLSTILAPVNQVRALCRLRARGPQQWAWTIIALAGRDKARLMGLQTNKWTVPLHASQASAKAAWPPTGTPDLQSELAIGQLIPARLGTQSSGQAKHIIHLCQRPVERRPEVGGPLRRRQSGRCAWALSQQWQLSGVTLELGRVAGWF